MPAIFLRQPRKAWQKLRNRDAMHTLAISTLACLATAGLLYLVYLARCLRTARRSGSVGGYGRVVLLFGKRLRGGAIDRDYAERIRRVHVLIAAGGIDRVLLLGGRSAASGPAEISEAAAAQSLLLQLGVPANVELVLEDASVDTLQNLRHARDLLARTGPAPVLLVSSRYHLARCALLARNHGFDAQVCAAEPRLEFSVGMLGHCLIEAGYLMWTDVGTGWARLLRNKRMLDQVT